MSNYTLFYNFLGRKPIHLQFPVFSLISVQVLIPHHFIGYQCLVIGSVTIYQQLTLMKSRYDVSVFLATRSLSCVPLRYQSLFFQLTRFSNKRKLYVFRIVTRVLPLHFFTSENTGDVEIRKEVIRIQVF